MNDKKIVSKKNSDYFFTEVYMMIIVQGHLCATKLNRIFSKECETIHRTTNK